MRMALGLGIYEAGARAFSPLSLPSLLFWGNAEAANIVLTSGKVSQMTDLSGNGNHAVQTTAGHRPIISAAALNGHDVVTFASASTAALIIPYAAGFQPSLKFSIFAVWRWNNASHGSSFTALLAHQSNGAWSDGWGLVNGPAGTDGQIEGFFNNYSTFALGTTYANMTWRATAVVKDAANFTFYTDGSQVVRHAASQTLTYSNNCQTVIGAYNNGSGGPTITGYTNADLAELIICGDAFSTTQLAQLHARAQTIYGTP